MSEETSGQESNPPVIAIIGIVVLLLISVVTAIVVMTRDDSKETTTSSDAQTSSSTMAGSATATLTTPKISGSFLPDGEDSIGSTIPTIVGTDYTGKTVKIAAGKPQLIILMAHWCPHCQAEIPLVVKWHGAGDLPSGVDIVGISTAVIPDRGNYPPQAWLTREKWPFPVLADGQKSEALSALGATSFPTMIAVNADGKVTGFMSGELEEQQVIDLMKTAL